MLFWSKVKVTFYFNKLMLKKLNKLANYNWKKFLKFKICYLQIFKKKFKLLIIKN